MLSPIKKNKGPEPRMGCPLDRSLRTGIGRPASATWLVLVVVVATAAVVLPVVGRPMPSITVDSPDATAPNTVSSFAGAMTGTHEEQGDLGSSSRVLSEPAEPSEGATSHPSVYTNSDMGIEEYPFLITFPYEVSTHGVSFTSSTLRIYLKLYCSSSATAVAGFAGLFPANGTHWTSSTYFYKQPPELQQQLRLSVSGSKVAGGHAAIKQLHWLDRHGNDMGFWPFIGQYNLQAAVTLHVKGSQQTYQLPIVDCSRNSSSSIGRSTAAASSDSSKDATISRSDSSQAGLTPNPVSLEGIWNVVTTTDPNHVAPETLARLLLLHGRYHRRVGFQGTILRCNSKEAQTMAALPELQEELGGGRLVIWPWEWAVATHRDNTTHRAHSLSPYFWQVPRNQLALLAGHGQKVKLTYFDLDEYLILPSGAGIQDAVCHGKPLLDNNVAAWSFLRYAALCTDCTGAELDCWEAANAVTSGDGGSNSDSESDTVSREVLQSKLASQGLQVTQCPCIMGKTLVNPVHVENTKVHKTAPVKGYHSVKVDPECGYLLHMQALISNKRPWGREHYQSHNTTLVTARWLAGQQSSNRLWVADGQEGIVSGRECLKRGHSLLQRCNQI